MRVAVFILFHLTCHEVSPDDDPPVMNAEADHSHGEVLKFTCPRCNHKVTLDIAMMESKSNGQF